MKKTSAGRNPCPEHQAEIVFIQLNPVSGTKYTMLDTTPNVRIIGLYVGVTWTVQPSPLELYITIDGQTLKFAVDDPESVKPYYPSLESRYASDSQYLTLTELLKTMPFFLEGRSVKIEVEITGGTVSRIDSRVLYAKW